MIEMCTICYGGPYDLHNPTLGRYIIWGLGWLPEKDDDQAELSVNWVERKEKAFQRLKLNEKFIEASKLYVQGTTRGLLSIKIRGRDGL